MNGAPSLGAARSLVRLLLPAVAAVAALAAGAVLAHGAASQPRADSSSWPQNGDGYAAAVERSKTESRPMFVYFRTDWCPYCREFEQQLLGAPQVDAYLRGLARVRVNPEAGEREGALGNAYGVEGYPAIFWQRGPASAPVRISRTVRGADGQSRLKTPAEFVAGLRRAAGS